MAFRRAVLTSTVTALLLAPTVVSAQFLNPGFETPLTSPGAFSIFAGGTSIGAWSVVGSQVLLVNNGYTEMQGVGNALLTFQAHSGLNSVDFTGDGNKGTTSGIQQSIATTIGQQYSISFWVGKATGNNFYSTPSVLDLSIDGGSRVSFTNSNNIANIVNWQQFSYGFTATNSSTLVSFYNGTGLATNNMVGLDDVEITLAPTVSTVPEPSSVVLMAGGLLGLAGFARRRRSGRVI